MQALEGQIGRPLAGVRVFDLWDSPFPDPYTTWLRYSGHTVFLSVRSKRVNDSVILWRDIANAQPGSTLYNQIVGWPNNVKAFGAPMYFMFNPEPEAAASDSMGTAQDSRAVCVDAPPQSGLGGGGNRAGQRPRADARGLWVEPFLRRQAR